MKCAGETGWQSPLVEIVQVTHRGNAQVPHPVVALLHRRPVVDPTGFAACATRSFEPLTSGCTVLLPHSENGQRNDSPTFAVASRNQQL